MLHVLASLLLSLILCGFASPQTTQTADLLFTHARLLDGTGADSRSADVAIKGDRITFVGDATKAGVQALRTINLDGLYLAPGFIDLHTHTYEGLSRPQTRENLNYLMQGVTTVVSGNDGESPKAIGETLRSWERNGIGTNAALMIGFGTVREQVLGMANRAPTADELRREGELVRDGMRQGALGLSTGLFYVPQSFSETDEVIALAKAAAQMGGYYDTHLRDENSYNIGLKAAVAEAIQISREAEIPVSISHIKCLGRGVWGQAPQIIEIVRQARTNGLKVAANQYPYEASGTSFDAAVLPNWAAEDGRKQLLARIADPPTHARLLKEIPPLIEKRGGPASLVLIGYAADPSLKGKSLQDIAAMWHVEPAEAVLRIIRGGPTSVVSHNMQESDIVVFMKQDWVATASDGESALPAQLTHPRSFGTFAVKIEKYVEAEHVISLPFAIRAATSLPASIARLKERGTIAVGNYADIVVFDPTRVHSPATYTDPAQYAQGFVHVLVNGRFAIENGKPTHVLAGRVLRGPATDKTLLAAGPSR